MTEENQQAIEDAPEETLVADNESEVPQNDDEPEAPEEEATEQSDDDDGRVEFPKKAVNALRRKDNKIAKLRAQMRELETKLESVTQESEPQSEVNEEDYDNYADFLDARIEALVEQKALQTQTDAQKQQLEMQKQQLQEARNQYLQEQVQEVAQTLPDLPQVLNENAALLSALPKEVADIFYSIDNAPAAVYMLAKENKLEGLLYANPQIAVYEIVNAQNKGMELLSKPKPQASQAPTPISKAKGTGSVKKQLSPNDDVLKSLGLK